MAAYAVLERQYYFYFTASEHIFIAPLINPITDESDVPFLFIAFNCLVVMLTAVLEQ